MHKTIEVFTAGCPACREAVETVRRVAGAEHHVQVQSMHETYIADRAKRLRINSVPAVVIDGKPVRWNDPQGINEGELRSRLASSDGAA